MRWYSSAIGSLTLRIRSPSPHTSSAVGRIFAPAVVKSSSGMDEPTPAPASMTTSWPPRTNSWTPAGVIATRYSLFLTSRGIPIFMAVLPDSRASLLFRCVGRAKPVEPQRSGSIYGHDRNDGGAVVQLSREDFGDRLLQRQPRHHQRGLLRLGHEVALLGGHLLDIAGQEDPQPLGAEAGRGVVVRQQAPVPRPVARLLHELPLGGGPRRLPGAI